MGTIIEDIVDRLRSMDEEKQRRVLEFTAGLSRPVGEPGWLAVERTKSIRLRKEDVDEIARIIEEDFEQVDLDEWNKDLFSDRY